MKNTFQNNRTNAEVLQNKYSTNLITRFELQVELFESLNITINEAVEEFGVINRRVFGIARNRQCKFLVKEVALYIENALIKIDRKNISYLSLIDGVIFDNPLDYTMLDIKSKNYLIEEMEMLPEDYSVQDLEEYVIDNLQTDTQIMASLYNKDSEELEFLESACSSYGFDFKESLENGF